MACLEKELELGMVYSSAICIDEQGKRIPFTYKATASGWIYRKVAFYVPVTILLPTVMIRAEALSMVGGFDENMERFEDTDMWRRVARRYSILAIPEPLCKVRTHSGNEWANQDPEVILGALTYYVRKAFDEDCEESVVFRRRGAARFYLRYGEEITWQPLWHEAGRKFLVNSIRYWPIQKFAYVLLIAWYLNKPMPKVTLPLRRGLLVILMPVLAPLYTTRAIWHRIRNWLMYKGIMRLR